MHQIAPLPGSALAAASLRRLHLKFSCFLVAAYGFQLPAVPLTQRARSSKHSGLLHANFVHAPTVVPARLLCAFLHLLRGAQKNPKVIRTRIITLSLMQLMKTKKTIKQLNLSPSDDDQMLKKNFELTEELTEKSEKHVRNITEVTDI